MWYFSGKGDSGNTNLFDGSEISKSDPVLELVGVIDEVNAFIGLAISFIIHIEIKNDLKRVQSTLSQIMGVIAGAPQSDILVIEIENSIEWLEARINFYGQELNHPKGFTFSGKTTSGAALDVCRTITRRMERKAICNLSEIFKSKKYFLVYINRLSSFFYILRLLTERGTDSSE